jgi:methylphosphotriester-DNA--protein-cysteine methyltransferase
MTNLDTISADIISKFIQDALQSSLLQSTSNSNECSLEQVNLTATTCSSTWSDIFETGFEDVLTPQQSHQNTFETSSSCDKDEDILWQAVLDKNPLASNSFVYCVKTTKIYCRSTCASRRPERDNVLFANNAKEAERLGFRACMRCNPNEKIDPFAFKRQKMVLEIQHKLITPKSRSSSSSSMPSSSNKERKRKGAETNIKTIASEMGVSVWHLHKVFKRETGLSPEQWLSKETKH